MYRNEFTPEERAKFKKKKEAEKEALQNMIVDMAESYKQDPKQIADFLAFSARFHNYSPRNVLLIRAQNPGALLCKPFLGWKEEGAKVNKGETGMRILVPAPITYLKVGEDELVPFSAATPEQQRAYQEGLIPGRQKMAYKVGSVFDIAQTDYPVADYPKLLGMGEASRPHSEVYDKLKAFAQAELNCPVAEVNLHSAGLRGQYFPDANIIEINHLLGDTEKVSTLAHEIGHALMHHDKPEYSEARKEFEADCVSVMLASHLGLDIQDNRKAHLADHYKKLHAEAEDEELEILEIFNSVHSVYDRHIDRIDTHIKADMAKDKPELKATGGESAKSIKSKGMDKENMYG